jgi:hypothetical protein
VSPDLQFSEAQPAVFKNVAELDIKSQSVPCVQCIMCKFVELILQVDMDAKTDR